MEMEEYNQIPVYYCRKCLSLNIKSVGTEEGCEFCDECGSTDIVTTTIEEWENLYKNKHGHRYLESDY